MSTDDVDAEQIISRLAGPLSPPDRKAFRRAAEDALTRVPCWGEGALYRAVAALQRAYFNPPNDRRMSGDISQELLGAASSPRLRRSGETTHAVVAVALARRRRLNGENAQLGNAELNECR